MQLNLLDREKLFMGPAFFTIASSFTHLITICIPCLALHYKGHLGLENKPVIGNLIQQCKVINPNTAVYNWVSLGLLTVLLFYSFVNYLSLLCHNSYAVTSPLKSVYDAHYVENNRRPRFVPSLQIPGCPSLTEVTPLSHIRTDEQRLALRFLLETAQQPVSHTPFA